MIAKVFHNDGFGALTHVADIDLPDGLTDEVALNSAWRFTQNIEGSWSRGERFDDGTLNGDYCPRVRRLVPLPVLDGTLYGLRSSMVGDVFEIEGRSFRVASIGFEPITEGEP